MDKEYIEKHINAGGLRICYYDEGMSDRVLLLLHAFPLNKEIWLSQLLLAGDSLRVVAPDLRGFGGTEAGEEEFSLTLFNKDLENFISTLNLPDPILCGLSFGGFQSLFAATVNAERYRGFVFCSTQCIADSSEIRKSRLTQIRKIEKRGLESFAEEFCAMALGESPQPSVLLHLLTSIRKNSVKPLKQSLLALAERPETCTGVKGLPQPVLILAGKEDRVISFVQSELLKSTIGEGSIYLMEEAGHFCNVEKPEEFNQIIRDFLDANFVMSR